MALQVWLPLIGNTNNYGLLNGALSISGATYVDGKLGKCLQQGQVIIPASMASQILNNDELTIAFWVYVNAATGDKTNRTLLFGNDSVGAGNNRKFSIYQYPTCNDLHWSWMNDTASTTFAVGLRTGALPSYKWTHVALVYNNPSVYVYVNGSLVQTGTGVSNSSSFAYDTYMIRSSTCHMFNDYRLYNHALSAREVKEISKGMVCHYPLNDIYATRSINKYSGSYFEGFPSHNSSKFTFTKLTDERGYNVKSSRTGTGSNYWISFGFPSFSFIAGKTYDYSCKIRCRSSNMGIRLRASRCCNDWVTQATGIENADGKWHEYHVRQVIPTTFDRAGTTMTSKPELEFYTDSLATSGKAYSCDFDIKDVQVSECDVSAPASNGAWKDNIVYDISGFGNHGKVTDTSRPSFSNGSPRYDGCYQFNGSDQFVIAPTSVKITDEITVSIWAYMSSWANLQRNGPIFSCTENGGWNLEYKSENGCINFPVYANGAYRSCVSSTKWSDLSNGWHHFAVTYDGLKSCIYIDGVLNKSLTSFTEKTKISYHSANTVFLAGEAGSNAETPATSLFNGKLSDFRLYGTALSASDVKELYNTPISITDTGVMMTQGEFKEDLS